MASEKLIRRAKVTLTTGKTYTVSKNKFIRNVPRTIKGELIDEFKNNGRFSCVELEPKVLKKKKKVSSSDDEVTPKKKKSSKDKSKKKKSSGKKKLK